MAINNSDIASIFEKVADILEIQGANTFRVRAYRNAARTVSGLPGSLEEMVKQGEELTDLPGIGKDLSQKIKEIVETGKLTMLDDLKEEIPSEVLQFTHIAGLGPKRAGAIYKKLGIDSIGKLIQAAREHKIRDLDGFGEKIEKGILEEAEKASDKEVRISISTADRTVNNILGHFNKIRGIKNISAAGSYRRKKETVGDIDIVVSCDSESDVMDHFVGYEDVDSVISKGTTKSSVVLKTGLQVDLRAVPEQSFGAALHYFTGSKEHNIEIRKLAQKKNLKVNEYGIFDGDAMICGKTEEDIFSTLGLDWIPPELRENRGEFEAASKGVLPELVKIEDIRGDLHSHTTRTDGLFTLEQMALAARERGYEYFAVTDHSKHLTVAGGLNEKQLAEQIEEINRLNEKIEGITILKGIEVDILADGSLDLSDDILRELDIVCCSVHYKFNLSRKEQTERIIRAMENPYCNIVAHPTGRLIGKREPYDIDMEKIMEAAKNLGCILEINSNPQRLDLSDIHTKMAKDMGILISIATDAHTITDLDNIRYGVWQGRRGWLEKHDVINTRNLKDLTNILDLKS